MDRVQEKKTVSVCYTATSKPYSAERLWAWKLFWNTLLPSRNSKYDLVDNSDNFDTSVEEQVRMWGVAVRAERKRNWNQCYSSCCWQFIVTLVFGLIIYSEPESRCA